ncbi:MAG: CBS domain-containing protein [Eubacteriales bacterium]
MLVKDLMSWPVITVFDNSTVGEALAILRRKNIKHLPVVDNNQALIGVTSETDLVKTFPGGRELSSFQSNLLSRTPVSKMMQINPIFVAPNMIVEQAALVMRASRISCLPVLDEDSILIGILSKNDILDAFIASLGLGEGGTRITIFYKKKWGFLSELISFADRHNTCIDNIVSLGQELVLKTKGRSGGFVHDLKKAGYNVVDVSTIDPPAKTVAGG